MGQADVSQMLIALRDGDQEVLDALVPLIYGELRQMAHRQLRRERGGHTLNTTALVNEAYLKLVGLDQVQWQGRAHFFAVAARAMRNILVDYAIRRKAKKRGGGQQPVPLDDIELLSEERAENLIALDEALQRLSLLNEQWAQLVEYRFFAGLSIPETAAVLEVSPATVSRYWTQARAWLNRELSTDA